MRWWWGSLIKKKNVNTRQLQYKHNLYTLSGYIKCISTRQRLTFLLISKVHTNEFYICWRCTHIPCSTSVYLYIRHRVPGDSMSSRRVKQRFITLNYIMCTSKDTKRLTFLLISKVHTNEFYICWRCTYIVYKLKLFLNQCYICWASQNHC
jgi:hypothetical protein